jgi:hypothetical protein
VRIVYLEHTETLPVNAIDVRQEDEVTLSMLLFLNAMLVHLAITPPLDQFARAVLLEDSPTKVVHPVATLVRLDFSTLTPISLNVLRVSLAIGTLSL